MKEVSILYVGSLEQNSNSFMRFKTLQKISVAKGINTDPFIFGSVFSKLHYHLNIGPGIYALNLKVLKTIDENPPDILLIDNKPYIFANTLKEIKRKHSSIKIANLIIDDPEGRYKRNWRIFRKALGLYDILFVQRKINLKELENRGARRIEVCLRSFDPDFHRPLNLTEEEKVKYGCAVGFIGNWESEREAYIVFLIQNGIPVKVTGNDWEKGFHWPVIKNYFCTSAVYGNEYIRIINGMDIALHFLRHANRDEQDSRTFEIPACGTFMLAEKSDVHLSLFEESKEAIFFETKEELLEKVKYYMQHADERQMIAKRGYKRCLTSGYTHEARLKVVLNKILDS